MSACKRKRHISEDGVEDDHEDLDNTEALDDEDDPQLGDGEDLGSILAKAGAGPSKSQPRRGGGQRAPAAGRKQPVHALKDLGGQGGGKKSSRRGSA